MRTPKIKKMTDDELVQSYEDICIAQDVALDSLQISRYNRLFDKMMDVRMELQSRPGDQRRLLLRLFNSRSMQVRIQAARGTLVVAPAEARAQLEEIAKSGWMPQAGDAGMCLHHLDTGFFVPK